MDVSPIQRLAITANQATQPVHHARNVPEVAPAAQAGPVRAEEQATQRNPASQAALQVIVAWHAGSLGYVTRVVDQHSGSVVYQSPPEQILDMVQKLMERLEGSYA